MAMSLLQHVSGFCRKLLSVSAGNIPVQQDQLVQPGAILLRQRGFRMHPGRNVDYGRDHTLYALREGHVKVTKELVERPQWCSWGEGPYFERTFMHVEERPKVRRLVCLNPESLSNVQLP